MLATLLSSALLVGAVDPQVAPATDAAEVCSPAPIVGVSVQSSGTYVETTVVLRGASKTPRTASVKLVSAEETWTTTVDESMPAQLLRFSVPPEEAFRVEIGGVDAVFSAEPTSNESWTQARWTGNGEAPVDVSVLRSAGEGTTAVSVAVTGGSAEALSALEVKLNGAAPEGSDPGVQLRKRRKRKKGSYKDTSGVLVVNLYQSGMSKPVWSGTTTTTVVAQGHVAIGGDACTGGQLAKPGMPKTRIRKYRILIDRLRDINR